MLRKIKTKSINQSIKWNKWKKVYKECKDHNSKSGNDRKVIDYYDDLDAILGKHCRMRLRMTHLLTTILCPVLILPLMKHHRPRLQSEEEEEVIERSGRGLVVRVLDSARLYRVVGSIPTLGMVRFWSLGNLIDADFPLYNHHHQVPSSWRLAVMTLHCNRSWASLTRYSYRIPVHSVIFVPFLAFLCVLSPPVDPPTTACGCCYIACCS